MGLWANIFGGTVERAAARDPSDDFWFQSLGAGKASAGELVTVSTAMQHPVVWDCLQVLNQTVSALPLVIFERLPDGSKREAVNHPLADLIQRQPNAHMTAMELRGQMVCDLAAYGNAFVRKVSGARGDVDTLEWINPAHVQVIRTVTNEVQYDVWTESGPPMRLLREEVWHVKRPPFDTDGLCGVSPIEMNRETIGHALAVMKYGARFFANDATPSGIIKHPGNFKDQDSKTNFLNAWKRWFGGGRRHSPALLEYGMDFVKVGSTNDEAQFLETKKESAIDIARIWRIPPHKIASLERATFSNIEHQSLEFVQDTILPICELIEQSMARDLFLAPQRFFAEHNLAGLLRGDLPTRYAAYATARQWGWMSVNDVRRLENMNPIAGGDAYLQPLNMVDAQEPAPASEGAPAAAPIALN